MRFSFHRRILLALGLTLGLALVAGAPTPGPAQTLTTPLNNAESTLAADHLVGSGTLILKTGDGAQFGTPSVGNPVRITVARRPTMVNGDVKRTTLQTIFNVTARSGDTLSGLTAVEGTSDQIFFKNDAVLGLITAGMLGDLNTVVSNAASAATTAAAAVAGKADDSAVVHRTGTAETIQSLKRLRAADASTDAVQFEDPTGVALGGVSPKGVRTVKTKDDNAIALALHNIDGGNATTAPFRLTSGGALFTGVVDNVGTIGFDRVANVYPGWTLNLEQLFKDGSPPLGLSEWHLNHTDLTTGTLQRPFGVSVDNNTGHASQYFAGRRFWVKTPEIFGGTIELLNADTNYTADGLNPNRGSITIANDGSASVLTVNSYNPTTLATGSGFAFNTVSNQAFSVTSMTPATVGSKAKNSPILRLEGQRWNGSASVAAAAAIQCEIRSDGARYYLVYGANRSRDDGVTFSGVDPTLADETARLGTSPRFFMLQGHIAALRNQGDTTLPMIGLGTYNSGEDIVSVAGAGTPIHLGGPIRATGAAYTDKPIRVQDNAGTGLFSVTGDGRTYFGPDNGGNAFLNVNKPAAFGGSMMILQDASAASTPTLHVNGGADSIQFLKTGGAGTMTWGNFGVDATQVILDLATKALTLHGSLSVGSGTPMTKVLSATGTLDFPSIPAQSQAELTIAVSGAAVGDVVSLGPPASLESGLMVQGRVTGPDTVTVRAANFTAGAIDPVSASYRPMVTKF